MVAGLQRRFDIGKHERALAEVVEHEGRQHNEVPALHQRRAAKVTDVRIHGLTAGDGEQDQSHENKAVMAVMQQEVDAVMR